MQGTMTAGEGCGGLFVGVRGRTGMVMVDGCFGGRLCDGGSVCVKGYLCVGGVPKEGFLDAFVLQRIDTGCCVWGRLNVILHCVRCLVGGIPLFVQCLCSGSCV